ncbi:MAG TPA: hypothetical protein VND93_02245 [Myxococcales bacterium]|nr:hypothetical protein [Myxococcales bacterium]
MRAARQLLVLLLLAAAPAMALPPGKAKRAVESARKLLGKTYHFGGRLRGSEGIDCQGVVFYALERISGCGWKSYSVFPTETVRHKELGDGVPGLFPADTATLDPTLIQAGDVVMLLANVPNPAEQPMLTFGGEQLWVWHFGMATGGGQWINADPFSGEVMEGDLLAYLREHDYSAIAVTRMANGPRPQRCRQHAPMGTAQARTAVLQR